MRCEPIAAPHIAHLYQTVTAVLHIDWHFELYELEH